MDAGRLLEVLGRISLPHLAAAILLLAPNLGFQFMKWRTLVRTLVPAAPDRMILRSLFLGFSLGVVTPGRIGEHARIACFGSHREATRSQLAALSLLDKLSSGIVTTTLGAAALLLLPSWDLSIFGDLAPLVLWSLVGYAAAMLASALLSLGLLFSPARVTGLLSRWPWLARSRRFQRVHAGMRLIGRGARLRLFLYALAFYATFICQFVLLAAGLGYYSRLSWAATAGTMFLKSLFPVSLGDVGVRELFAANLFETLGAGPELGITAAFLLFLINVLLPALAGIRVFLAAGGRSGKGRPQ